MLLDKKIDATVLRVMRNERVLGYIGITLVITGNGLVLLDAF